MTIDEAIAYNLRIAEGQDKCADISVSEHAKERISQCAADHRQLAEWLRELKEAKRLLQAAEKTIDDHCRGYCECCKNRDFELARCGLVNGCRDRDNWEWILSYRVKELFKEG